MVISPDERTEFETALLSEVMQLRKPLVGVCPGKQPINITLGGSLYQDIPTQIADPLNHRDQHNIKIVEGTMLYKMFVTMDEHVAIMCHPEFISGSQTMPGQEILNQVQNDTNRVFSSETIRDKSKLTDWGPPHRHKNRQLLQLVRAN